MCVIVLSSEASTLFLKCVCLFSFRFHFDPPFSQQQHRRFRTLQHQTNVSYNDGKTVRMSLIRTALQQKRGCCKLHRSRRPRVSLGIEVSLA